MEGTVPVHLVCTCSPRRGSGPGVLWGIVSSPGRPAPVSGTYFSPLTGPTPKPLP